MPRPKRAPAQSPHAAWGVSLSWPGVMMVFAAMFAAYLVLLAPYLGLPPLGKHAWNEAIYMAFLKTIDGNGNPFHLYAEFDPNRPDYNVGYLYFWASFVAMKLAGWAGILPDFTLFRLLSLLSTFLTLPLLYLFLREFGLGRRAIAIAVAMLLFSPLVVYYGWKAQLEPFLICVFLASQLLVVRSMKDPADSRTLAVACLCAGALVASRSNFITTLPLYALPAVAGALSGDMALARRRLLPLLLVPLGATLAILPSQLMYPEDDPSYFFFNRIMRSASIATFVGDQILEPLADFLKNALAGGLCSVLPLALLSPFAVMRQKWPGHATAYYALLGVLCAAFLAATYAHVANHTYHIYYCLPWFALAAAASLEWLLSIAGRNHLIMGLVILLLVSHAALSYSFLHSYYGLFGPAIFQKADAFGTYSSYIAGSAIHDLISAMPGYSRYTLAQSPVLCYPVQSRCAEFHELQIRAPGTSAYSHYPFAQEQEKYVAELMKLGPAFITQTPDMDKAAQPVFTSYLRSNFTMICATGSIKIRMDNSLLASHPDAPARCSAFLRDAEAGAPR